MFVQKRKRKDENQKQFWLEQIFKQINFPEILMNFSFSFTVWVTICMLTNMQCVTLGPCSYIISVVKMDKLDGLTLEVKPAVGSVYLAVCAYIQRLNEHTAFQSQQRRETSGPWAIYGLKDLLIHPVRQLKLQFF